MEWAQARLKAGSLRAYGAPGKLCFQSFPAKGELVTHAADNQVRDSAAAATALATGKKTNNGMSSQSAEGNRLTTILELSRDAEKATGLVATSTITYATPACFAAHLASRKQEAAIAAQMLASKVNLMLGGGAGVFSPQERAGRRKRGWA